MPDPLRWGRFGEALVAQYLTENYATGRVRWVNEGGEQGKPYDIEVKEKETGREVGW